MEHQIHFVKKFYLDKKTGYWISTEVPKIRAHVWVWQFHNGMKPKGYHVHHIDENKSNNDISNLQLIKASVHLSMHMTEERKERARIHAENIRPLTKEWHRSKEGKQWHSDHASKTFKRSNSLEMTCVQCDMKYDVDTMDSYRSKFCSNKCKSKNRRDNKIDHIEKICIICNQSYKINRYAKSLTCSRKCGGVFKSKEYRGRWV